MEEKVYKILCINTGSTSTKVAVYDNDKELFDVTLDHDVEELKKYPDTLDQVDMRKKAIYDFLAENNIKPEEIDAVAARGGPNGYRYHSGAYKIDEAMVNSSLQQRGSHPMNLGPILAYEFVEKYNIPAYNYDVVMVDEADEIAHVSSIPGYARTASCHTLNSRAAGRAAIESMGKKYEESTIIVGHYGGGCSTSLHQNGRVIDTSNDGFSPTRAGATDSNAILDMCFNKGMSEKEIKFKLGMGGGLSGHLGTADLREVEAMVASGDEHAKLIYDAFIYNLAKAIGSLSTVVGGKVDAIVLTGGIAHSKNLTDAIIARVGFIAPVKIVPGSMEMEALAKGILRVLRGEEKARTFNEPF